MHPIRLGRDLSERPPARWSAMHHLIGLCALVQCVLHVRAGRWRCGRGRYASAVESNVEVIAGRLPQALEASTDYRRLVSPYYGLERCRHRRPAAHWAALASTPPPVSKATVMVKAIRSSREALPRLSRYLCQACQAGLLAWKWRLACCELAMKPTDCGSRAGSSVLRLLRRRCHRTRPGDQPCQALLTGMSASWPRGVEKSLTASTSGRRPTLWPAACGNYLPLAHTDDACYLASLVSLASLLCMPWHACARPCFDELCSQKPGTS